EVFSLAGKLGQDHIVEVVVQINAIPAFRRNEAIDDLAIGGRQQNQHVLPALLAQPLLHLSASRWHQPPAYPRRQSISPPSGMMSGRQLMNRSVSSLAAGTPQLPQTRLSSSAFWRPRRGSAARVLPTDRPQAVQKRP